MSAITNVKLALSTGRLTYHGVSEALRAYQSANGLPPSGEADDGTIASLEAAAAARAAPPATPEPAPEVTSETLPEPARAHGRSRSDR